MFQEKNEYKTIEKLKNALNQKSNLLAPASTFASRKVIGFGFVAFGLLVSIIAHSLFVSDSTLVSSDLKQTAISESISPESGLAQASMQFDEVLPVDKGLPDIHVTSALVKELGSQENIFSYRPRARWPIASITKLMTAVVALDEFAPNTLITISQEAVDKAVCDQKFALRSVKFEPGQLPTTTGEPENTHKLVCPIPSNDRKFVETYDFVSDHARSAWCACQDIGTISIQLKRLREESNAQTRDVLGRVFKAHIINLLKHNPQLSYSPLSDTPTPPGDPQPPYPKHGP
jgi:hypothetical protein